MQIAKHLSYVRLLDGTFNNLTLPTPNGNKSINSVKAFFSSDIFYLKKKKKYEQLSKANYDEFKKKLENT